MVKQTVTGPEGASRIVETFLNIRSLMRELQDLTPLDLNGLAADELFFLFREICLLGRAFFSESFVSHRSNNPDLVVKDTDTGQGLKTEVGTVISKRIRIRPPFRLERNEPLMKWFEQLHAKAKELSLSIAHGMVPETLTLPEVTLRQIGPSEILVRRTNLRLKDLKKEHLVPKVPSKASPTVNIESLPMKRPLRLKKGIDPRRL